MINTVFNEDCLIGMQRIPDKSIDMILCDLPYGTTQNKWDSVIDLKEMWREYRRVVKNNGAIVLTSDSIFTANLMISAIDIFKYKLVWDKVSTTGFLNANKMPLRRHEDVCVFYQSSPTYNPQMAEGKSRYKGGKKYANNGCYGDFNETEKVLYNMYHPTSIICFSNANQKEKVHPTQKPVALFEYLIKTYTNEGETVLDNCMGSGTTAIACINTNRNYIGFEKEEKYFNIIQDRIKKHTPQLKLIPC